MVRSGPVARTVRKSIPRFAASTLAFGTAFTVSLRMTGAAGATGAAIAGATGAATTSTAATGSSSVPKSNAITSVSVSMIKTGLPISTTSPGFATSASMTPSAGASTSMSILSVITSNKTSPLLT